MAGEGVRSRLLVHQSTDVRTARLLFRRDKEPLGDDVSVWPSGPGPHDGRSKPLREEADSQVDHRTRNQDLPEATLPRARVRYQRERRRGRAPLPASRHDPHRAGAMRAGERVDLEERPQRRRPAARRPSGRGRTRSASVERHAYGGPERWLSSQKLSLSGRPHLVTDSPSPPAFDCNAVLAHLREGNTSRTRRLRATCRAIAADGARGGMQLALRRVTCRAGRRPSIGRTSSVLSSRRRLRLRAGDKQGDGSPQPGVL